MTGIDRIITVLRQAAAWVRHARAVARQRRALARINDPRILSDLGISEAQALFEVSRAPWDTDLESIMPPRPRLVREPLAANQRWMPRSRISSV